jgi:hypothetical protein
VISVPKICLDVVGSRERATLKGVIGPNAGPTVVGVGGPAITAQVSSHGLRDRNQDLSLLDLVIENEGVATGADGGQHLGNATAGNSRK